MRENLIELYGKRLRFRAVVDRFGVKPGRVDMLGRPAKTILLKDVVAIQTGELVTDHIWFTVGENSEFQNQEAGDIVEFDARVSQYGKGYRKEDFDYRLSNPTRIEWVGNNDIGLLDAESRDGVTFNQNSVSLING